MANQGTLRRTNFVVALAAIGTVTAASSCHKDTAPPPAPPAEAAQPGPRLDVESLAGRVGVKPGGLSYAGVGPSAALMWSEGTVTVRRAGEDRFGDTTANLQLQAGDEVLTGPHTEATIAFADNTLVQLAEETLVAIGNRAVSADPASSVSVLYGVARLSVSPRARGEGAFITTAGTSLIGAKGTAFAVGVVAGGHVRIGVEHGEIEVAGARALDKPITLQQAESIIVEPTGALGAKESFKSDDWGDWRFAAEAKETLDGVERFHADHLVGEESRLDADYLVLQKLVTTASSLTWQAEGTTGPKALAGYKATAMERAASIEAAYRLAGEIARLTSAALSDAYVLGGLYERHPKEMGPQVTEFTQEIGGALLYDKKLQLVSEIYLVPLRSAYYAHTPRGRARAASLDMPAPTFAQVKLVDVPAAEIAKRIPPGLYVAPTIDAATHPHPLWQRAPKLGWDERLTLQPVPPRQGSWYVAPARVDAHLFAGVATQTALAPGFPVTSPTEPGKADLAFLVPPLPPMGASTAAAAATP
jgi:FecR-like protein